MHSSPPSSDDPKTLVYTGTVGEDQVVPDAGDCTSQIRLFASSRWYDCGRDRHDHEIRHKFTGRYEEIRWDDEGHWERRIIHD